MLRRFVLSVGLVAACAWCLVLAGGAGSAQPKPPAASVEYKTVAPVPSLMHGQEYHFDQIKELVINETAENRFVNLRHEAMILAELCNINAFRAPEADYRAWAEGARENCLKLAEAASKQDLSSAREIIKSVQNACRDCHDKYE